jgi:ABC-type tungstate transport system substrate-binding protein
MTLPLDVVTNIRRLHYAEHWKVGTIATELRVHHEAVERALGLDTRGGLTVRRALPTLLWDGRFALATGLLAGFGRATAEVGAVLIVGGNIAGYTRTMTTSIALETSKGDLPLALGLGIVLIALTMLINAAAFGASRIGARFTG